MKGNTFSFWRSRHDYSQGHLKLFCQEWSITVNNDNINNDDDHYDDDYDNDDDYNDDYDNHDDDDNDDDDDNNNEPDCKFDINAYCWSTFNRPAVKHNIHLHVNVGG